MIQSPLVPSSPIDNSHSAEDVFWGDGFVSFYQGMNISSLKQQCLLHFSNHPKKQKRSKHQISWQWNVTTKNIPKSHSQEKKHGVGSWRGSFRWFQFTWVCLPFPLWPLWSKTIALIALRGDGFWTDPRHPNTWWVGVWTSKHLLRRLLGVPNTYSPGIWRILDV